MSRMEPCSRRLQFKSSVALNVRLPSRLPSQGFCAVGFLCAGAYEPTSLNALLPLVSTRCMESQGESEKYSGRLAPPANSRALSPRCRPERS